MYLNNANNTIGWQKHSSGGMANTVVDIRMIMCTALQCGASSIVLSHNHPSGTLKTSAQDDKLTYKLIKLSAVLLFGEIIFRKLAWYLHLIL